MARISLSPSNYSILPEGTYIFRVKSAEYKEAFGKLTLTLETQDGKTHTERYGLLNAKREPQTGALNAFSYTARCCLNYECGDEIDPDELVGKFFSARVEHTEVDSSKNPGETRTFVKLVDKHPAPNGWEEAPVKPAETVTESDDIDLDALLDD